jgi:hypothetical protein
MELTRKETKTILRQRANTRFNGQQWVKSSNWAVLPIIIIGVIIAFFGAFQYGPGDSDRYCLRTADNQKILYDGDYLMKDGHIYAEKYYKLEDGTLLQFSGDRQNNLTDSKGIVYAVNNDFNPLSNPYFVLLIAGLSIFAFIMLCCFGIWIYQESQVSKEVDEGLDKLYKPIIEGK